MPWSLQKHLVLLLLAASGALGVRRNDEMRIGLTTHAMQARENASRSIDQSPPNTFLQWLLGNTKRKTVLSKEEELQREESLANIFGNQTAKIINGDSSTLSYLETLEGVEIKETRKDMRLFLEHFPKEQRKKRLNLFYEYAQICYIRRDGGYSFPYPGKWGDKVYVRRGDKGKDSFLDAFLQGRHPKTFSTPTWADEASAIPAYPPYNLPKEDIRKKVEDLL